MEAINSEITDAICAKSCGAQAPMPDAITSTLTVTHTLSRDGKPLATIEGLPGTGAEMTPPEMRALAAALQQAARDCEQLPIRRGARRCVRSYGMS